MNFRVKFVFRVEFVRPRSGRASDQAAREMSTCLSWRVFVFISRQKWGVTWLAIIGVSGYLWKSFNGMAEIIGSTLTRKQSNVCVFLIHRNSKFVYSVLKWLMDKDFRRKLMISGGQKKDQSLFESSLRILAVYKKQFEHECTQHDCFKTARLCRLVWILNWSPERRNPEAKVHFWQIFVPKYLHRQKDMMSRGLWSFFN